MLEQLFVRSFVRNVAIPCLALIALLLYTPPTYSEEQVFSPVADASICQISHSLNNVSDPSLVISYNDSTDNYIDMLIKVDHSSLTNLIINWIKLCMYCFYDDGSLYPYIYQTTSTWSESVVTWNTRPSYDSSIIFSDDWIDSTGWWQPIYSDDINGTYDLARIVKEWIENPSTNYGLRIISDYESTVFFRSSVYSSSAYHPQLNVNYSPTPVNHEPYINLDATETGYETEDTTPTFFYTCGDQNPDDDWKSGSSPSTPGSINYPASDCDGSFTVSWSSVSGATSYTLQGDTNASFISPTQVYNGPSTSSNLSLGNATYYFRVGANNSCGSSSWRTGGPIVVGTSPSVPGNISYPASDSSGSFTVSWSPVSGATDYTLQRDTNATFTSPAQVHNGSSTFYNQTGLVNGFYFYRVKANNSCGSSEWKVGNAVNVDIIDGHCMAPIISLLLDNGRYPGSLCGTNKIYDCVGACVDEATANSWIGDRFCDDGRYGIDLTCEAFDFDHGDCLGGQICGVGIGMFYDCVGFCVSIYAALASLGDGYCDDGAYGIYLNCDYFNFDGGDCGFISPKIDSD